MPGEEFYLDSLGLWRRRGWAPVRPGDRPVDPSQPEVTPVMQVASVALAASGDPQEPQILPVVSAGPDGTITVNTTRTLAGTSSNATTLQWTRVSGPAVTITNPTTLRPTVTPSTVGSYVFRLTGTNTVGSASDDMTLTVSAPVINLGTRLGACPPSAGGGPAAVITKFGTGACIRAFNGGGLGAAQARPAGTSVMHASWKPALGSTISDASIISSFVNLRDGDLVEVQHESDVKYRKGTWTAAQLAQSLALKDAFHAAVVRLRNAGSIPNVLTVNTWAGWAVDSSPGSPNRLSPVIHCDADVLGIDMDGIITTSDAYYPFAARQLAETRTAMFSEGYSYPGGWTVPEFCMPLYEQTDPTAVKRIAWFQAEVPKIVAGLPATGTLPALPPPRMIAFFDFDNLEPDEGLHLTNEIAAWRDLVQQYAP